MLKLSVVHNNSKALRQSGMEDEPSQSYESLTQMESISESEGLLAAIEVLFALDWDQWLSYS